MDYIRRLFNVGLVLIGLLYGAYFSLKNLDAVRLVVPFLGEFHVAGFVAYLGSFAIGALFASVFFSIELMRKSFQLRKSRKELGKAAQQPHKRVSRFLEEDSKESSMSEPVITSNDSKLY